MMLHPSRVVWLKLQYLLVILALVVSAFAPQVLPVQAAPSVSALQFNGTNQYVTFGNTRVTPGRSPARLPGIPKLTPNWARHH